MGCIYSCAKPNVEVKASIMDIQQVIPLHINNGCIHISMPQSQLNPGLSGLMYDLSD